MALATSMELIGEAPSTAVVIRSVVTITLTTATRSTNGRSWVETEVSVAAVWAFMSCLLAKRSAALTCPLFDPASYRQDVSDEPMRGNS
jgi:hypothetical protein